MNKEEFYQGINKNTFAGADFCQKLYGYCYMDDTFLEKVMDRFKSFGRDKVIYIYSAFVKAYIRFQVEKEREIAHWYSENHEREWEKKQKGSDERRTQRETKQVSRKWMEGLF